MKKILIFIAMVAMIASVVSAQATVSVSGAIKTEIGMDLDTMDTGIKIEGDGVQISIATPLDITEKVAGAADDGDTVYGEIGISGITIKIDTGWNGAAGSYADMNAESAGDDHWELAWGKVYSKLVLGNFTVLLGQDAGTDINYQGEGNWNWYLKNAYEYPIFNGTYGGDSHATIAENNDDSKNWEHPFFDVVALADTTAHGSTIAAILAIPSIIDIRVDAASRDTWEQQAQDPIDTDDDEYYNQYLIKASIDLKAVENLTVMAGINFSNYQDYYSGVMDETLAIGAKLGYKIMIGESDYVSPVAALTFLTDNDGAMAVSGGLEANVAGIKATAYTGYQIPDLSTPTTSLLAYTLALDLGLVENLTVQVAYANQTTTTNGSVSAWVNELHGKLAYAIAVGDVTITPSAQLSWDDKTVYTGSLYAKAEVSLAGVLDNTTFSLRWDSNDLSDEENYVETHTLGQLVFKTKVSF
jgi:hypothetical protein